MMPRLNHFLESYPWDKQVLKNHTPLETLWEFELKVDRAELWSYLIDTSKFNRALGLPKMNYEEKNGQLHGSTVNIGLRQVWIEDEWQWTEGESIIGGRSYSKGLGRYVRVIYDLSELKGGQGVRLRVYFGWLPKNIISRLLLRGSMTWLGKRYGKLLSKIENEIHQAKTDLLEQRPDPLGEAIEHRIEQFERSMIERKLPLKSVRHLLDFIRTADELNAHRLRVPELARKKGIDETDFLRVCLHATRLGLLHMSWDLVCPHCRGVRAQYKSLSEVGAKGFCEVCSLEFGTDKENVLEITFQIHAGIRDVPKVFYCAAEPSGKQHIKLQQSLAPGERKEVTPQVTAGRYRLRVIGEKSYKHLDITSDSKKQLVRWDESDKENYEAGLGFSLRLENINNSTQTYIMEDVGWSDLALRPRQLFNFDEFRDLFSEEFLDAGVQLAVGSQTILFTDIVGSSRFYAESGDPKAFTQIRKHFDDISPIIARHEGVVVKTMGDAVMSAFSDPLNALKSAANLQSYFHEKREDSSLRIRISLSMGPCIAVNLNSNIDYYGKVVNTAAKLQAFAKAGEIVFTDSIWKISEVRNYIKSQGISLKTFMHNTATSAKSMVGYRWKTFSQKSSTAMDDFDSKI